jgi:hypothetical protein
VAASTRIQLGVPAARFFRERKEVEKKEITDILSFFQQPGEATLKHRPEHSIRILFK